jgi:hypothetical protein
MIDPRNDIVGLFTNQKISGSDGNVTRYVQVDLREDNENSEISHNDVGCLILEEPFGIPECISIGGLTYLDSVNVTCNLWVYKTNDVKHSDALVNSLVNTFQNAIIDNHSLLSSVYNITIGDVLPVRSENSEILRRTILLYAFGVKNRNT